MNENAKTAAGMSSVNMDKSTDGMNPAAGNNGNDMWTDGVMGVLIGDALGNPVQFMSRSSVLKKGPVKGMESGGAFNMPAGSWTDDGSMTLAALDSLTVNRGLDYNDIMKRFVLWNSRGAYTPFGKAYDQGRTCMAAISRFEKKGRWDRCGEQGEYANGNGGLMRIMPVCLYAAFMESEGSFNLFDAVMAVQRGTLLTHGHLRACTASGIYFFLCREILRFRGFTGNSGSGADAFPVRSTGHSLKDLLQRGMDEAVRFYSEHNLDDEFSHFSRMKDLSSFAAVPAEKIRSSGYVVHTLEAAVWCLITTGSLEESLLKAVNLGDDADTVGAVTGGLASLFYGYGNVPAEWKQAMQKRAWLEDMCRKAADTFSPGKE